jgi:hypothetical protein
VQASIFFPDHTLVGYYRFFKVQNRWISEDS